jgi:hypothetical protein
VGLSLGMANSHIRGLGGSLPPGFAPLPFPSHAAFQGPLAPTLGESYILTGSSSQTQRWLIQDQERTSSNLGKEFGDNSGAEFAFG